MYGQYGLHGSIVNVSTNLNINQIFLPWMSYEDYSISVFLKRKWKYKVICMFGYVQPNIVIKTFIKHICM
jgi:hypothetical protein